MPRNGSVLDPFSERGRVSAECPKSLSRCSCALKRELSADVSTDVSSASVLRNSESEL
jgi:hypothetical protein